MIKTENPCWTPLVPSQEVALPGGKVSSAPPAILQRRSLGCADDKPDGVQVENPMKMNDWYGLLLF